MANDSRIEWTEATWNPTTGCTKISSGCKNCYAATLSKRLKAMGLKKYKNEFQFTEHPFELETPLRWKKPRKIFVNSMSDLFHEKVPLPFIQSVFKTMKEADWIIDMGPGAGKHGGKVIVKPEIIITIHENRLVICMN